MLPEHVTIAKTANMASKFKISTFECSCDTGWFYTADFFCFHSITVQETWSLGGGVFKLSAVSVSAREGATTDTN